MSYMFDHTVNLCIMLIACAVVTCSLLFLALKLVKIFEQKLDEKSLKTVLSDVQKYLSKIFSIAFIALVLLIACCFVYVIFTYTTIIRANLKEAIMVFAVLFIVLGNITTALLSSGRKKHEQDAYVSKIVSEIKYHNPDNQKKLSKTASDYLNRRNLF